MFEERDFAASRFKNIWVRTAKLLLNDEHQLVCFAFARNDGLGMFKQSSGWAFSVPELWENEASV